MRQNKIIVNDWQVKAKQNRKSKYAIIEAYKNRRPLTKQAFATIDLCLFMAFMFVNKHTRGY